MQTPQILIYKTDDWKIKVDTLVKDETIWLNQEQIANLYWKAKSTINEHIKNIYDELELDKSLTLRKFGNSEFMEKPTNYYNLDMVLAIWYRVKSSAWTQFRIWATTRLKEYLLQWFSLNESKLKTWKPTEYFDKLQEKLREIRLSERVFYQKIKDIYTTSSDYDPKDDKTINFFKIIQNKLLWAISQKTAAELVYYRTDSTKPFIWMQSCDKKTINEITKHDVSIAKNYLDESEMKTLWLIVEQYLAFAENMAQSQIVMTMDDWIKQLDLILQMNKKDLLTNYWKISHNLAVAKAEKEFDNFKEEQRKLEKIESINELEQDLKKLK